MSLEIYFPRIQNEGYQITSPATPEYNCVAWAVNENDRWWWPDSAGTYYWPETFRREETVDAFREVFESLGYAQCNNYRLETGFDKVAVFADQNGLPTHVARQLSSGRWTSKIGNLEDIEHSLQGLENLSYGSVSIVLRRPVPTTLI